MLGRVRVGLGVAGIVVLTVLIRLPGFRSDRHIDFDEGVYGASLLAMRAGYEPFRDVFSSQGPLFLPLLWLFDVAGLRSFRAARLGMVLTAVAITVGVYVISRRVTGRDGLLPSLLAAAVVGTAGAGIAAAGPMHSDGPALAAGVWAIAVVLGSGPFGRWRPAVVGMLIGAGMALKSAFLLPVALAVAWHYARRREWPQLGAAAAVAATVGFLAALPWGLAAVWDQFVAYQLDAPRDRNPVDNLTNAATQAWRRDAPFLAVGAAGLVAVAIPLAPRRRPPGDRAAHGVMLVWLAATVVFLFFGTEISRGSYRFLFFLIVPAMVAFAAVRPPVPLTVAAAVVTLALVPAHLEGDARFMKTQRLSGADGEIVTRLAALPAGALVVADDPGLAWAADRYPPPDLVDPSWARLRSGYLTADAVRAGAARADVCAVVFATGRFDWLDPRLARSLVGYGLAEDWGGGRRLYVKESCG